ncbi:PLP-dependent transferase [Cellulomonas fimi]|uniref:Cys/Met metabolism pyridoxal-phosphate-dependent protein n=1 Tax=Cellulomonas fimi (strain ATCC 484 / DSM 20113 / JCM 1341 / CCUG 24087 / LMG 16345 / NBRC 15513 / NCIMB 8980 / NCTC 7547 / NRS-133) TaxID=590998 RepID=F4H6E1_CELFA|nr:PLP-dependent transferase [Cellulomonas fimi]AEE44453.1 Cys/Met metabolism pyridoxal-phosphate-dependent protein [Cellulomonas fimi ATCC 484]NNH06647.1 PLP-dependent transferase [Cellulomonas fimi]VEH26393.1 cystathionine gamma-lyase [Cellulomonas fimi]
MLAEFVRRHLRSLEPVAGPGDAARAARVDYLLAVADRTGPTELLSAYESIVHDRAAAHAGLDGVASGYASMAELWDDVARQEVGTSDRILWDSYLNGHRVRVERALASATGADTLLLTVSGMSAIDAVLTSALVPAGATVAVSDGAYFESATYLDAQRRAGRVSVATFDPTSTASVGRALARADVLLLEPADNAFPVRELDLAATAAVVRRVRPDVLVVVDTSLFGPAIPLSRLTGLFDRVVAVQSGSKYLTTRVSAGVVAADAQLGPVLRERVRQTGIGLPEAAVRLLVPGELASARERFDVQARGAQVLARAVDPRDWVSCRQPQVRLGDEVVRAPVLFLEPAPHTTPHVAAITDRWVRLAADDGGALQVRAGFGWALTTCRAYGADQLNRPEGRSYVRVSVGLEPAADLVRLGELLAATTHDVLERAA